MRPPDKAQLPFHKTSLRNSIAAICDAWDAAVEAERSRGYPSHSPLPAVSPGVVRLDPGDPLHTRSSALSSSHGGAFGDPTGNAAFGKDRAGPWLREARSCLGLLLSVSGVEIPGERRWTGPFHPPSIRQTLLFAAEDVVDMWPNGMWALARRIDALATTARHEWPPTPKPGEVIDGVKVGQRPKLVEVCCECGSPIGANSDDPLARIDGRPYHRQPCYNTVWRRNRRRLVVSA